MNAKDVKIGERVFVEMEGYSSTQRMVGLLARTKNYDEAIYVPADHPVYRDLLGLCERLRDELDKEHCMRKVYMPDFYFHRWAGGNDQKDCDVCDLLKEADAVLGPEK